MRFFFRMIVFWVGIMLVMLGRWDRPSGLIRDWRIKRALRNRAQWRRDVDRAWRSVLHLWCTLVRVPTKLDNF